VNKHGQVRRRGSNYFASETLRGHTVGLDLRDDGDRSIFFGPALLAILDERGGVVFRLDGANRRRK